MLDTSNNNDAGDIDAMPHSSMIYNCAKSELSEDVLTRIVDVARIKKSMHSILKDIEYRYLLHYDTKQKLKKQHSKLGFGKKEKWKFFPNKHLRYDCDTAELVFPYFDEVIDSHFQDLYSQSKADHSSTLLYSIQTLVKSIETILEYSYNSLSETQWQQPHKESQIGKPNYFNMMYADVSNSIISV